MSEVVVVSSFEEADEIHALAVATDPDHDRSSCWCCCMSCELVVE